MPRHPPCALLCLTSKRCRASHVSLLCKNAEHFCQQIFNKNICLPCTFYGACRFAPSVALTAFFLLMSFLSKNTKCFHFSYSLRLILSSRYSVFKVRSAALFPLLWRLRDSNSRPPACKAGALPTELSPHLIWQPPTLPCRLQHSTIGRPGLNFPVQARASCSVWVRVFPPGASPPDSFFHGIHFKCFLFHAMSFRLPAPQTSKQHHSPYFFLP